MRAIVLLGLAGAVALAGCDQDYAASNAGRETFMGREHAFEAPSVEPSAAKPVAVPVPAALPVAPAPAAPASSPAAGGAPAPKTSAARPAPPAPKP